MRFIDEYRDAELGKKLADRIEQLSTRPARLMEFCGGHYCSYHRACKTQATFVGKR